MMLNGKKLICWLAALAPVLGLGQQPQFIIQPRNETVCAGEDAVIKTQVMLNNVRENINWFINGTSTGFLPEETRGLIDIAINFGLNREGMATFSYNRIFDGASVQCILIGNPNVLSNIAYIFYKTNQQNPVTGLTTTVTNTTAQFDWDELSSNFTTHYLFGLYGADNNLIANQTTNATRISYSLPPRADDACQYLEFRVTGVEVQYPECPDIEQSRYSAYLHIKPDIAPVTAEFDNQTVQVNWKSDGGSTFQIIVMDLESGEQSAYNGTSPFSYTPTALCGQPVSLNISVSPAECPNEPSFTHRDSINFTIPCPTTVTDPETEVSGEHSGTQTLYPYSLPVLVGAAMLRLPR